VWLIEGLMALDREDDATRLFIVALAPIAIAIVFFAVNSYA
jgi:hypothetical protein